MKQEILRRLQEGGFDDASTILADFSAIDVASFLEELVKENEKLLVPLCKALESELLADALVLLSKELQEKILVGLSDEELKEVMDEVSVEDTVEIIEEMPDKVVWRIAETEEIVQLLKERNFAVLKPLVAAMHENDLALVFEDIPKEDFALLFRILPKDLAAETFVELDRDIKEELIHRLNDREIELVLKDLFLDDTVDLLEEMPANVVKRLLSKSDKATRAHINQILHYPKDSAGSIMTIEYVSLRAGTSVANAFEKIRKTAIDKETIYTLYVTDDKNKLIGFVSAKELMISSPDKKIGDIMEENVIYSFTTDDKEDVARKISNYGFLALPIVDQETRLVGIVTVDDAIDVLQEETTEDIEKMAAISPSDKPYLKTSVFSIWKNRIPWLLILMIGATFTGLILNTFEGRLNAISSVLFACVPMLMDTGGNSGSQASVTVIRSLALGELKTKDVFKVLWKEFRAGLLLGLTLAVACFAKLLLIDNLLFGFSDYTPVRCLVVSVALFSTLLLAKIVGCSLPLIAKKCKLDPAVVASPFITTIVDALSLVLYCYLAVFALG
ncbi:MAG: magnesium transporter [Clostridia bacterium]|nr:magnesium transporter [Clostridia bacterium]